MRVKNAGQVVCGGVGTFPALRGQGGDEGVAGAPHERVSGPHSAHVQHGRTDLSHVFGAIGIALVPPLCVVGYGIGTRATSIASGAALLFTANFCAILLFTVLAFLCVGYSRASAIESERLELAKEEKGGIRRLARGLQPGRGGDEPAGGDPARHAHGSARVKPAGVYGSARSGNGRSMRLRRGHEG